MFSENELNRLFELQQQYEAVLGGQFFWHGNVLLYEKGYSTKRLPEDYYDCVDIMEKGVKSNRNLILFSCEDYSIMS